MQLKTAEQVSEQLGLKPQRVYELCRQGILPHVRLGRQIRIVEEQLNEWLLNGGSPLPGGWRHDPSEKLEAIRKRERK